eukprot:scaffold9728_cov132-Isochrysis_galbana.AAC.4
MAFCPVWTNPHISPVAGPSQVNTARLLAGATLAFAIVSCLGLVIPYWFPGLGGLFGIIGTSIILCCGGNSKGGHIACAVLCGLATILHAAGVGLHTYYYVVFVDASASTEVAAWIGILIWPAVAFNGISMILEAFQVGMCIKASSAIAGAVLPTSVKGGVQA